MTLRWRLTCQGGVLREGEVVNDVVVTRGKVARLTHLGLEINNRPFVTLRSDGLILSTPTGATGYAGSAGGPLLLPTLNAYVVAAICPYLSSFPPLALTPETMFSVRVAEAASDLYLTLDGQEVHAMGEGDRLDVWGEPDRLLMVDFGLKSYFDRLKRVGFVQETKTPG
jgi:NAD+ kinase